MTDPKSANDYDDRGASAVHAVLLEIGQLLGSYRDNFVVIGGSVPWLLLPNAAPDPVALGGFKRIAEKFTAESSFGPVTVREFLRGSDALGDMTADQVQVDAFRQVQALLQRLGLWSA